MDFYLNEQQAQHVKLSNLYRNYLTKVGDNPRKGVATSYLQRLDKEWQTCEKINSEVFSNKKRDETHPYFTSNIFQTCEDTYYDTKGDFLDHIDQFAARERAAEREADRQSAATLRDQASELLNSTMHPSAPKMVSLAKLNIPVFDGSFEDWENFRDLFRSLVHNREDYPNIGKFTHLRTLLKGEAKEEISHIQLIETNYLLAWETLNKKYENHRKSVSWHLTKLFSMKSMKTESSAELKKIIVTSTSVLEALRSINRPVKYWDDLIVHFITDRFEVNTRKEWEKSLGNSVDPPTFNQLREFCQAQISTLETIERSAKSNVSSRYCTQIPKTSTFPPNSFTRLSQTLGSSNQSTGFRIQNQRSELSSSSSHNVSTRDQVPAGSNVDNATKQCPCCQEPHSLWVCSKFLDKSSAERFQFVADTGYCAKCLNRHSNDCSYKRNCDFCKKSHNTLIHVDKYAKLKPKLKVKSVNNTLVDNLTDSSEELVLSQSDSESDEQSVNISSLSINTVPLNSGVLLSTALVYVIASNGLKVIARALVDQCSQVSLISENLVQRLKLDRHTVHVPIAGVGDQKSTTNSRGITQFTIKPRFDSSFACSVQAAILPKITSYKPPVSNVNTKLDYINGLRLADPHFTKTSRIDLLLGASVHSLIIDGDIKRGQPDEPLATSTQLGWVLSGNVPRKSETLTIPSSLHCMISDETDLNEALQKFWRQEEAPSMKVLTHEENECEEHFLKTHKRDLSGKYIVRLPIRKNLESVDLGGSYTPASRMLNHIERKFQKDERFKLAYTDFLKDYLDSGHMSSTGVTEINQSGCFFLPHHGVLKESSSTTKLRTVFNGSAKTGLGFSLNDFLLSGENLLPNLVDLLCHWRKYKFVFAADAEKMFRQILVNELDRKYQSILWRFNTSEPVQIFRLNTVTYGLKSSPFLASRVIKQLAIDHQFEFPLGAEVLTNEIYMDDVLSGAHTLSDALLKQNQTIELCKVGGFPLRKWMSNHPDLVTQLDTSVLAKDPLSFDDDEFSVNILGITWHPTEDVFRFHVKAPAQSKIISKRYILSNIAKLFDPLGWLGPVVITAKMMMQSLWLHKVGWDSPLPTEIVDNWSRWQRSLDHINSLRIPRWNNYTDNSRVVEIHGFADASKLAFGAVIYLRVVGNSMVQTSLQMAKSRVAPLKTLSIPRLELLAAELLTVLVHHLIRILRVHVTSVHLWTDSMDVLYWLKDQPARWETFVGNRTSKILTLLPNAHWHHIRTKQNPADIISRGIDASQYGNCELWWQGPNFLAQSTEPWSTTDSEDPPQNRETELKVFLLTKSEKLSVQTHQLWDLIEESHCMSKLLRLTSYCLRFIVRLIVRIKANRVRTFKSQLLSLEFFDFTHFTECDNFQYPSASEIIQSRQLCIYFTQMHHFAGEISSILKKRPLNNHSSILNLNPILVNGLLRVGGRLSNSLLDSETQHPFILPEKSNLTRLIVLETHLSALHGGTQLTLATVRRQYWILRGRSLVRSLINKCITCKRYSGKFQSQIMGELPRARVTPSFPFENSGVDFAGPYNIRLSKVRGRGTSKGYICIFVCMSTRAVHIEAVEDYTSDAFIAAFYRFTSRRGHCSEIFSDRGTNFVGADRLLREMFLESSSQFRQICFTLAKDYVKWNFNPPGAPHCGGLWEAAVRSCKYHLKRILGDQVLTFVELSTLLARIEACLNSRPLLSLPDDPFDPPFLTPSHFLIQRQSFLIPEPDIRRVKLTPNKRWAHITQMAQEFWHRWSLEYLTNLQPRGKWKTEQPSLQIGDLVILKNETTPPAKWPLGRVIKADPGPDGVVRVVTIKTPTTTLDRHVVKTIFVLRPSSTTTDESGRSVGNSSVNATISVSTVKCSKRTRARSCCDSMMQRRSTKAVAARSSSTKNVHSHIN